MFCSRCGHDLPDDARFCSNCGTEVGAGTERTTGSLDPGLLDRTEQLASLPKLAPGTGMLVVIRGPNAGSRYLLDSDTTTVGRHPDSDVFLDDVTVSRHHAELVRTEGRFQLVDHGSLNGTYVNGERTDRIQLEAGDEMQVGRFKLLFLEADE